MTTTPSSTQVEKLPAMTIAPYTEHGEYLFTTGLFSDCRIYCQGRSWDLHRSMLAPRCDFFRACFTSGFRESIPQSASADGSTTAGSNTGIRVSMPDDDPDSLDRMLRWMYTFSYPSFFPENLSSDIESNQLPPSFWTSELSLCILADKYDLSTLLEEAAHSILDTARTISDITSAVQCSRFTSNIDDFVDMLETLFTESSPSQLLINLRVELLDLTCDMIAKHIRSESRLSELMTNVPDFGVMLVQAIAGHPLVEFRTSPLRQADDIQRTSSFEKKRQLSGSNRSSASDSGAGTSPRSNPASLNRLESTVRDRRRAAHEKRRVRTEGRYRVDRHDSGIDLDDGDDDDYHSGVTRQVQPREKVHIPMNEDSDLE